MLLSNVDVTVTQSVQKNATHVKLRNDSFDEIFTLYNITNSTSTRIHNNGQKSNCSQPQPN